MTSEEHFVAVLPQMSLIWTDRNVSSITGRTSVASGALTGSSQKNKSVSVQLRPPSAALIEEQQMQILIPRERISRIG